MNKNIALIGNPNSGKTTLFNALTGSHQKVGNWTGVTTEKKYGKYLKDKTINLIDLPGLYSLNTRSSDEKAVIEYLVQSPPDVIINVIDGTNLERNLYLTTELLNLKIPLVIAITFSDRLKKNNIKINEKELSNKLGVPVISVSGVKGDNLPDLIAIAKEYKQNNNLSFFSKISSEKEKYHYIEELLRKTYVKNKTIERTLTKKIDKILLSPFLGFPILICVISLVYYLSISLGGIIGEIISSKVVGLGNVFEYELAKRAVPEWITSLLCHAIIKGIGVVLSFFPQILILFALLAVLEESGYTARSTFIVDRLFAWFGLGGKSFIPMILGCGCTVSGLMATRTIESRGEKRATIFLTPFMPCGAKTAVFGWFASIFANGSVIFATSMYFLSILCVVIGGKILHCFKSFKLNEGSFVMEIPTLRLPRIKDVWFVMIEKVKDYTTKAGLIIFIVSVVLWALENLGITGYVGNDVEKSFLFFIGNKLKYVFYPVGCTDWRTSVALVSGVFAKEAVIETLELLSQNPTELFINSYSAYAFCSFILLSPPCIASIVQAKHELKSNKWLFAMLFFQTAMGYLVASLINFLGFVIVNHNYLILSGIVGIIIVIGVFLAIKKLVKMPACKNCAACKGDKLCQREKRYTI